MIFFLTFSVILVTLVGQGLMLPAVIRALGIAHIGRHERQADRAEEYQARREAIAVAAERLKELKIERHLPQEIVDDHLAIQRDQIKQFELISAGHRRLPKLHDEVELLLIDAERQHINDLFRNGKLNDEARRRIERELDLREAQLANQRADE
jgi:CPA1 family monovalent cation:H+ antiporter